MAGSLFTPLKCTLIFGWFLIFLCKAGFSAPAQTIQPRFDERVELMSVVFYLAKASEYQNETIKPYVQSVNDFFHQHKNHDLIDYVAQVRNEYGIAYDAVMSYALHLKIQDNEVIFNHSLDKNYLDPRWTEEVVDEFLALLNAFYRETNFRAFFENNKELYEVASNRFSSKFDEIIDLSWFYEFMGYEMENKKVLLSFINFGFYGPSISYEDGTQYAYAIMSCNRSDDEGLPVYTDRVVNIAIHEFLHSYCNPLADKYYDEMEENARIFFDLNREMLAKQAYGSPETFMRELLVRACNIMQHRNETGDPQSVERLMRKEQLGGFTCMDKIVEALKKYEHNRDKFDDLKQFMPFIVDVFNSLDPQAHQDEFEKKLEAFGPQVIHSSVEPDQLFVNYNIGRIVVEFDQPMYEESNLHETLMLHGGRNTPEIESVYWKSATALVLEVNMRPLTHYSISFREHLFFSEDNYPLSQAYILSFITKPHPLIYLVLFIPVVLVIALLNRKRIRRLISGSARADAAK